MKKFECQPETWFKLFQIWTTEHAGERPADLTQFESIDKPEEWVADAIVHTLIRPTHGQWEVALVFADPLDARHFIVVPCFTADCPKVARKRARQLVGPDNFPFSLSVADLFDSWN